VNTAHYPPTTQESSYQLTLPLLPIISLPEPLLNKTNIVIGAIAEA
jgi:hypothetical protein